MSSNGPTEEAKRIVEDILISHIRGSCTVEVEKIEKKIAAALAARDEEIAKLKAERAAAVVEGMERARKHVCRDCESEWPLVFRNGEWFHLVRGVYHWCRAQAIDAEIANVSKPQPDETTELKAALDAVSFPDRRWK